MLKRDNTYKDIKIDNKLRFSKCVSVKVAAMNIFLAEIELYVLMNIIQDQHKVTAHDKNE